MWPERAPFVIPAALLETLALIAWRQPVTRGEIEAVRWGVGGATQIMKTLQETGLGGEIVRTQIGGVPASDHSAVCNNESIFRLFLVKRLSVIW